jgi:hypothetical protein
MNAGKTRTGEHSVRLGSHVVTLAGALLVMNINSNGEAAKAGKDRAEDRA